MKRRPFNRDPREALPNQAGRVSSVDQADRTVQPDQAVVAQAVQADQTNQDSFHKEPAADATSAKNQAYVIGVVLGAVLVLLISGFISYTYFYNSTNDKANSTVSYVRAQSISYEFYNSEGVTKSSMRAIENANVFDQLTGKGSGELTRDDLRDAVDDLRLTGAFVLRADGTLVTQYSTDGTSYKDLESEVEKDALLNVADNPKKTYSSRFSLDDGSAIDLAASSRANGKEVIVVFYRTTPEFVQRYTLSQQSLLSGFDVVSNGTIVIENADQITASNDDSLVGGALNDYDTGDHGAVLAIRDVGRAGAMTFVASSSGAYLGMMDKVQSNYIYIYYSAWQVALPVLASVLVCLMVYVIIVSGLYLVRRNSKREYLERSLVAQQRYNETLKEARDEAESANRSKTEFLQRMSHDIRTPINGVVGMVAIAQSCPDDKEKQADCLNKIRQSSKTLLGLINEVLDMSKLESGEVMLEHVGFDICDILSDDVALATHMAKEKLVTVSLDTKAVVHRNVLGSPIHVNRIMNNIISNAVKYNKPEGTLAVTASEHGFDGTRAWYRLVFADAGIGMSKEFQKRLFDPFAQEGADARTTYSGTGLGMPIVKSLVEVMNGTIDFTSEQGVGTTYVIEIPFEVDLSPKEATSEKDATLPSVEGVHALLVEDNELNAEIAEYVLMDAGVKVSLAANGAEALKLFKASAPGDYDVIIMDVMMPVMDGYEATAAIRASERPDSQVPIIAMTANAFSEDRIRVRQAGMNEHVAKPLDTERLIHAIAHWTRRDA